MDFDVGCSIHLRGTGGYDIKKRGELVEHVVPKLSFEAQKSNGPKGFGRFVALGSVRPAIALPTCAFHAACLA